jgi:hypothetical protein
MLDAFDRFASEYVDRLPIPGLPAQGWASGKDESDVFSRHVENQSALDWNRWIRRDVVHCSMRESAGGQSRSLHGERSGWSLATANGAQESRESAGNRPGNAIASQAGFGPEGKCVSSSSPETNSNASS